NVRMHRRARGAIARKGLDIPFSCRYARQAAAETGQAAEAVAGRKINGGKEGNPVPEEVESHFEQVLAGAVGEGVRPFEAAEGDFARTDESSPDGEHELPSF